MAEVIKFDDSRFQSTWKQYVLLNKRELPALTNKLGYEISKLCVVKTPAVPKDQIRASLEVASRVSPTLKLGELLANKVKVANGQPALVGQRLAAAGQQYQRLRARSSNFLRAGFIPGVQRFSQKVRDKSPRTVSGVRIYGRQKGGAEIASDNGWTSRASLWNSVQGGIHRWFGAPSRNVARVQVKIEQGIQEALNAKEADMRPYIERKLKELIKQFNNA